MKNLKEIFGNISKNHNNLKDNLQRSELIQGVIDNKDGFITIEGAIATWTPTESTGRSPKDTYIVETANTKDFVDWTSPNNIPLDQEIFDELFEHASEVILKKESLYKTDRVVGADTSYA